MFVRKEITHLLPENIGPKMTFRQKRREDENRYDSLIMLKLTFKHVLFMLYRRFGALSTWCFHTKNKHDSKTCCTYLNLSACFCGWLWKNSWKIDTFHFSPFDFGATRQSWNKLGAYLKTADYFNRVLGLQSAKIKSRALTVVDHLCARVNQSRSHSRDSFSKSEEEETKKDTVTPLLRPIRALMLTLSPPIGPLPCVDGGRIYFSAAALNEDPPSLDSHWFARSKGQT